MIRFFQNFQSPQTPRSFGHQSPTASSSQSPASHIHMRTPMHKPSDIQGQIQRNSPSPYSSPGQQLQENNRQLRDLLQQQPQQNAVNTFRQPLPPGMGMIARPQRFMGPQQPQQQPLQLQQTQQQPSHQQHIKSVITVQNTPIVSSTAENIAPNVSPQIVSTTQSNMANPNVTEQQQNAPNQPATDQPLENLDDVNAILGDLNEDDDDEFLKSFTADMGIDFNILEYADPELDSIDAAEQSNLLDSFVFDDTEEKDKVKRAALEKLNKANENKVAMGQLKANINPNNDQQGSTANPMASNVQQTSLSTQIAQARAPQTQQQIMMQQRYGPLLLTFYNIVQVYNITKDCIRLFLK